MRRLLLVLTASLALAGCGVTDDEAEVREVTERFYAAIRDDDGQGACAMLSAEARSQLEGRSGQCEGAVTRLRYEGGDVETAVVYVTNAKVEMSGGESAFLSDEPDGWRLSAVGCKAGTGKPRDRPFECELEA